MNRTNRFNRFNRIARIGSIALCVTLLWTSMLHGAAPYEDVLRLKPLGFWPADEGEGVVLHDRSGNGHHAKIFHVPWKDGLLNFTPAFQWAEVPGKDGLLDKEFSIGGWLFNRSPYSTGSHSGAGATFMGFQRPARHWELPRFFLRLRRESRVEVIIDKKEDVLGSYAAKNEVAIDRWQHLLFTYSEGTAKLYINGALVQSKEGVPFSYNKANVLQMGGCGQGWQLFPSMVNSFQGSLSGMVLFDRALRGSEVEQLLAATRPTRTPKPFSPGRLVFNGRFINDNRPPPEGFVAGPVVFDGEEVAYGSVAARPLSFRYRLLENLARDRGGRTVKPTLDWLPDFAAALSDWRTRWPAAKLLMAIKHEKATAALTARLPQWIKTLDNRAASGDERAACALAMAEMGKHAGSAIPALAAVLDEIVHEQGVRIPRVEDTLRNAAIYALFRIDPNDKRAEAALTVAFAKPVIDALDLAKPLYADVKRPAAAGKYMQALDALRKVRPGRQTGERYFSQGDRFRDVRMERQSTIAYTTEAEHNGTVYWLGNKDTNRRGSVAEPISKEDFQKAVRSLSAKYPQAATWRKPDAPNLFRMKINKTDAAGNTESAYLVGEDFVFDGTDKKVRCWSIGVDTDGYLHLIGGQHNYPDTRNYIAGSFLRMGLSEGRRRDSKYDALDPRGYDPKYPAHMYWVSKEPGDITSFEFVGSYESPRKITRAGCVNYMNFVQDNNGVLYCYFRTVSIGFHSLGLHRYDVRTRRWSPIGGDACDLMAAAEKENPEWRKLLVRSVRNGIPKGPQFKALTWAWQPNFYNYMRSWWGVRFDRTNRMHVEMPLYGLTHGARLLDTVTYAYSDDGGQTFHRPDGSRVRLPLTNNPAQDYNADLAASYVGGYWELWKWVLQRAGYL
ncbi:MAG: BNR-4 repeat-containing protein [Kiritimatiellae bacterium]|nr:BNR-4 repeat-containing protein [Kiritimatiellia bacterium]